jgi:hypothetical protein
MVAVDIVPFVPMACGTEKEQTEAKRWDRLHEIIFAEIVPRSPSPSHPGVASGVLLCGFTVAHRMKLHATPV